MYAFVILILAALSRFLPFLMPHAVGLNFTAVGAGLLFFGSRRPRWQALIAIVVMALTDVGLTVFCYHYPFHLAAYLTTWIWYGAACLLGSALLRKVTALRVVAGVLGSSTSFFLWSNFFVWTSSMYEHNVAGLAKCYWLALPFYGRDLLSTAIVATVLFGLPVLATKLVETMHSARNRQAMQ